MSSGNLIRESLCARTALCISTLALSLTFTLNAQETNSHVSGIVKSEKNEVLPNATVVLVHEPTKNIYFSQTNSKGYFHFFNIKPGGPYSITVSYTGFQTLLRTNLSLNYGIANFYSPEILSTPNL